MSARTLDPQVRVELLRLALDRDPGDTGRRYDLAEALLDAGQAAEGSRLFREAFRAEPALRPASPDDLAMPDRPGVVERLATRSAALLDHGVHYAPVVWTAAIAAARDGDAARVRRLINYDAHFRATPAALPDIHEPAFYNTLAAELRAGMRHYRLDDWNSLREARRNSRIFADGGAACDILSRAIRDAVLAYVRDLLDDPSHPFVAARPSRAVLSGWSVTFDGASRHISHIHPRSWLSGVFYVVAPAAARNPALRRGWLRVGAPPGIPTDSGWDERWVAPEPGTMVLMPAYFSHETAPVETEEERLCVAFDVMPEELAGPVVDQGGSILLNLDKD